MELGQRAQSSVEYVMSYGWAVLVILVIGIVLWQLGVFNSQTTSMSFVGFGKLKPQLGGTGLSSTGVFEGLFTNGAGTKVFIKGVTVIDGDTGTVICCSHPTYSVSCQTAGGTNVDINGANSPDGNGYFPKLTAGDTFRVHIEGCNIAGARGGEAYNLNLEIGYDALSGKERLPHGDAGSIRGSFE